MSIRRDWYLQQMGITLYRLRNPCVLKGKDFIQIVSNMRLIIISHDVLILQEGLICDVLNTLNIECTQVITLVPEQLSLLPIHVDCPGWLLGIKSAHLFNGIKITTPILKELISSGLEKCKLWKQICSYDDYFFN